MRKLERAVIRHSVNDVIRILENEPVRPDMVIELTAAQVMNRVSIAHLSIERPMKFVITEAGGPLIKDHDLPSRLNQLRQYQPDSAKFLEDAFADAVQHYRYNANANHMKHLKSLDAYLQATGSDEEFQNIRYWELTQSTNEMILGTIYLTLHMELLYALREILLVSKEAKDTVSVRVERAVRDAMFSSEDMSYSMGSGKEQSVKSYIEWLKGFKGFKEAITSAFKAGVTTSDDFMVNILGKAHQTLTESKDPAVRYFAEILTVLPKQQRDAIPDVEWLGPEPNHVGIVSTPGGETLGDIRRRADGLWNITPDRDGLVRVSAIAESQTDARCHLADILTRPARLLVKDNSQPVRIVGEEHNQFKRDCEQVTQWWEDTTNNEQPTFRVTLWDKYHGITEGDQVRLEVPSRSYPRVMDVLDGTAFEVQGHIISVQGEEYSNTER